MLDKAVFPPYVESLFEGSVKRVGPHWIWTGYRSKRGRPLLSIRGRMISARKLAWALYQFPIRNEEYIKCTCGEQGCVAPAHLRMSKVAERRRALGVRPQATDLLDVPESEVEDKFLASVSQCPPEAPGCWLWTGAILKKWGVPYFTVCGKKFNARRVALRLADPDGDEPDARRVRTTCGDIRCVRPSHMVQRPLVDIFRMTRNLPEKEFQARFFGRKVVMVNAQFNGQAYGQTREPLRGRTLTVMHASRRDGDIYFTFDEGLKEKWCECPSAFVRTQDGLAW